MTQFSIITITKNNLSGLQKTAASVNAQTSKNYEWIIIDGASEDKTLELLEETTASWISEPDNGLYDAMNKGLNRATGDYVIFMNAGDQFADPTTLETIENAINAQNQKPDFMYGDAYEDENYKPASSHKNIKWGMFTHHQSMLYARGKIENQNPRLRFDKSYKIAADHDFTARFLNQSSNAIHIPHPICIFETGGLSQRSANTGRIEQFQIRKKLNLMWPPFAAILFAFQTITYYLRKFFPKTYWTLKSYIHSESTDNKPSGFSRIEIHPTRPKNQT